MLRQCTGVVCLVPHRYSTLLVSLDGVGGCNCTSFDYGRCPHKAPTDLLCDVLQMCYPNKDYYTQYCDEKVGSASRVLGMVLCGYHRL